MNNLTQRLAYEDAPLGRFHWRLAAAGVGGAFTDGFGLGIIGLALSLAAPQLSLTPLWLGLIGAASLAGLFLGALLTGPVADHCGRRPIFAYNMILLATFSILQYFAGSAGQLTILRLAIGFVLGSDYVVSKAVLSEFTPRLHRGRFLSSLGIAWAAGYTLAYFVGFTLAALGTASWRWMLLTGAVPSLLILPLRFAIPESPMWLADHGQPDRAARIVGETLGANVALPLARRAPSSHGTWRRLVSRSWRLRTLIGCTFFTCQVIPYFAIGTFVVRIIAEFNPTPKYVGGLFYNLALLFGAILGFLVIDRVSRRSLLSGTFAVAATAMLVLTLRQEYPVALVILLFAVFALALSAASSLVYVYLPELFPTELRASGIGLAVAASRIGSALSTFLLPLVVASFGVRAALGACVVVLVTGWLICQLWAPETRGVRLDVVEA